MDCLEVFFDYLNEAVMISDSERHVLYLNPAAKNLLNQNAEIFLRESNISFEAESLTAAKRFQIPGGDFFFAEVLVRRVIWKGNQAYLVFLRLSHSADLEHEVSDHRQTESKLTKMTEKLIDSVASLKEVLKHDELTGLYNRSGFQEILTGEAAWSRRHASDMAAILVNIDRFKEINAQLGHLTGDICLKEIALRIKMSVRPTDFVSRVAGDEFLVLLPHTPLETGNHLAEKIRRKISANPIVTSSFETRITVRTIAAKISPDMASVTEMLTQMRYWMHQSGGRKIQPAQFENMPEDAGAADWLKVIESELRDPKSFRVVKQKIMNLESGSIHGYEFLSRARVKNFSDPEEFFLFCMERDILTLVDHYCFKKCVEETRPLDGDFTFHLNLFPSTLINLPAEEIVRDFQNISNLQRYCIEISEQQILGDPSYLLPAVKALRKEGIRFAIDDVGFGKSCLESLVILEPDVIKIDKSCIFEISRDAEKRRLLGRLSSMLRPLNAVIVAEGVETEKDLSVLKELKIPYGQGFFWGRPE